MERIRAKRRDEGRVNISKLYRKYVKAKKLKGSQPVDEKVFRATITEVLTGIKHHWINCEGGVYFKRLGYFGVVRFPNKFITVFGDQSYFDRTKTDGYVYGTYHRTDLSKHDDFNGLSMHEGCVQDVKKQIKKQIKNGELYTLHSEYIKSYLKNRSLVT